MLPAYLDPIFIFKDNEEWGNDSVSITVLRVYVYD